MGQNWGNLKGNVFYQTSVMKKSSMYKISAVKSALKQSKSINLEKMDIFWPCSALKVSQEYEITN